MNYVVCNPKNLNQIREIVNNDLLLRHTLRITSDGYIPRNMIYESKTDKMIEIDEFIDMLKPKVS